jgi:hypothetical protein
LTATLINGSLMRGTHRLIFDAADLASGVYLYHLQAGDFQTSGKMVLMK